ncbi:MAG: DUF2721 domain-containing protein [Burkholderiales bacterium]|nr:DUF2721 domain-containing protein [Burkholderiales bacterium]
MAADLDQISRVIQLSVAPVFLLTGIGALLGVTTTRLARIVDRARSIETELNGASAERGTQIREEIGTLTQRARLINRAITLCVVAALLVCAVIVGLFITAYYAWSPDLTRLVAAVFALGLLSLIAGLLCFLREVYIATQHLRFGIVKPTPPPG